jgi:N6-L-threonylcarbamoyladenine synthase
MTNIFRNQTSQDDSTDLVADIFSVAAIALTSVLGLLTIAATAGPGLIGGVMVGLTTAKALALGSGKPLIAVNHLMGHALTARLTHGVEFPFLLLLVSGGHCQLVGVGGAEDFRLYGSTIDDAVGEAFDKTAKILGLPYPGGPAV